MREGMGSRRRIWSNITNLALQFKVLNVKIDSWSRPAIFKDGSRHHRGEETSTGELARILDWSDMRLLT
jgi:hypothetical protein